MSMDAMFRTNCSRWAPTSGMIRSFASEVELWKYFGSHAVSDCKQEMAMTPLAYKFLIDRSMVYSFEHSFRIQRWIRLNSDRVTSAGPPRSDYPFR